ncbi:MAG TPA: hypothetical protein VMZ28_19045 [Kofleriaceae bacterium]|nr:hypothetical protein [Kofleriaceae bacterium]
MSHHGLQRALVVALHDPAFVAALDADPDAALAPFDLDATERAQLLAVDRRAFGVDRLRRQRVLRAIVEELKGALAIALAEVRSLRFAEELFSSPIFHRAVAADRPLVLALADYLADAHARGRLSSPHLLPVLALERARAEARRDVARAPRLGLDLAPGLRLLASDAAALAALQAAEQHLFELSLLPHAALCDDRPALALPPPAAPRPLHLAVRAAGGEVAVSEIPEPLFRTLSALAAAPAPVRRDAMAGILAAVGLRVPDPAALVADLLDEAYLVETA